MNNKRSEYRLPIDIIVDRVKLAGMPSSTIKGYIREISASGCRLETLAELKLGQEVRASFVLMSGHVVVNARLKLLRKIPVKKQKLYAAKFISLPEPDQYRIREFIVWKESQSEKKS